MRDWSQGIACKAFEDRKITEVKNFKCDIKDEAV